MTTGRIPVTVVSAPNARWYGIWHRTYGSYSIRLTSLRGYKRDSSCTQSGNQVNIRSNQRSSVHMMCHTPHFVSIADLSSRNNPSRSLSHSCPCPHSSLHTQLGQLEDDMSVMQVDEPRLIISQVHSPPSPYSQSPTKVPVKARSGH